MEIFNISKALFNFFCNFGLIGNLKVNFHHGKVNFGLALIVGPDLELIISFSCSQGPSWPARRKLESWV